MLNQDEMDPNVDPISNGFDYMKANLEQIIEDISALKDTEKLLLCLLVPTDGQHGSLGLSTSSLGTSGDDNDLHSSLDASGFGASLFTSVGGASALHLSNQVEQSQAFTWIMSHLEEDENTCLRKDEVYEDYRAYCEKHNMKTLNTADFGKVMKRAFPNVKPRRLGQRGQSRYCYGGMRKRTEAQPPSLPDLTREAAGSVSNINNSSKGSSSVNNFKDISVNGEDSSLSDQRLRSLFGVQNGLLADVVHVLLEYAHLILGPQFSSLAQLAQYLVINRYVNSRSKHAFALIAFAENQSSSPSIPSTHDLASSLFDVLQRGGKSQTSGNSDNIGSLPLLPNPEVRTRTQIVSKISGQSNTPNSTIPYSSGTPDRLSQTSNSTRTSTPKASDGQTFHGSPLTTCNNALGKVNPVSNPTVDPVVPHMINTSSHNPVESTYSGTSAVTAAAVAASVLTGYSAALAGYPGYYPTQSPYSKQSTNSAQIRSQMPPSSETENAQDSSAAVALAAAAYAVHQHQLTSTNSNAPNAPLASPMIAYNRTQQSFTRQISPVNAGKTSTLATTFHSYSGESSASLGHRYNATLSPISVGQQTFGSYTAPLSAHSVLHPNFPSAGTLSSSPRLASPVDYCIPAPAHPPLGAGLGSAMSPYTPARGAQTSAISSVDVTSSTKRFTPPPIDAPGAYEPSPRFHLGGSSPNKRPRYFHGHPASVSTAQNIDIYDLPVPTSSFTTKSNAISVSSLEYNGSKTPEVRLPNRGASFYSGGYEGLGMFSPAPAPSSQSHLSTSPLSVLPVSSLTPSLPHVSSSTQPSWSQFSSRQEDSSWKFSRDTGYDHAPSVTGSIGHSSRNNISEDTSSRHYIPSSFALELDDDNDGLDTAFADHLPRLGASPGPQIPPSSPTEFLPFYSEAANKSRRRQTQGQSTPESCASADDRTSHSRIPPTSIPSSDSIGDRATGSSPLGTPPSSHDSGRERTDDPLNDDVDSALNRTLTNETHPDISRPIVDDDDDARCSQTRESFTSRGEVNTPSPPQ